MSAHVLNFNFFGSEVQFSNTVSLNARGSYRMCGKCGGPSARCSPCRRTTDLKAESQSKEVLSPSS